MTRSTQNKSLAIAGRNFFDDEASSSNNTGAKLPTPPKTLHEHSHPNSSGFQNPVIFPADQTRRIVDSRDILLIQGTCTFQGLRSEDPLRHVKHYLSIVDNIQADGATRDTSRLRFFHFSLKGKAAEWFKKSPLTQIMTWDQLVSRFLDYFYPAGRTSSLRDLILQFKQGDDESIKSVWIRFQNLIKQVPHHGIQKWLLVQIFHDNISLDNRRKLDQFAQFRFNSLTKEERRARQLMLEKKSHTKGIGEMLDQHRKKLHEQFSQILFAIEKSETPEPEAPTFAITTRSGVSTQDPPFLAPPQSTPTNYTEGEIEKEGHEGVEPSIIQEPAPRPSIFYQPSKSSNLPFPD
ncbi:DNA-directed DNA polymerase [Tanacetum coccineum]